ncbi:hypothetical protein [Photobacterium rosenbergii]|uniref:hypothetical protein n=1 Tax=Photobacterium rosenbergii TaxID=294936 RepID=UPI001C99B2A6|nr:hypothetical protein [Photobacterium rosenbergii]MBY5946007.1 hypothetical protein [Photobacterium rosenbergii]
MDYRKTVNLPKVEVSKWTLKVLNNLFEIEQKIKLHGDKGNMQRNVERIKSEFMEEGLFYEDPKGQAFTETRTDLDVNISGLCTENLIVTEVIRPIIRLGKKEYSKVVQKGSVVVQSKPMENK